MITFFIQLLIPLALMFYRFKRRKHFVVKIIVFGAIFCGISIAWRSINYLPFVPDKLEYYIYYLTGYTLAFIYTLICFEMPVFDLLFFVVAAFLVQNFSHHAFELLMRLMGVPISMEYGNFMYLFILGMIYAIVYTLFFFVFMKRLKQEDFTRLPKGYTLIVAVVFLLVMIILGVYVKHIRSDLLSISAVGIGYELYSVTLVILIIGLQFGLFDKGRLKSSNEELELRLEREAKYYEIARANMEQINIKCHDLKHQIAALTSMRDAEERRSCIAELQEAVDIYSSIAKTGNAALDCVLTDKGMYCQRNKITFTVIADGDCLANIKYGDIYSLFGNAMDNAIESVMKEAEGKRIIGLRVQERSGMVSVHLENYFSGTLHISDGFPVTSKKGDHGFGLKSIRYIVDKYDGNLTISVKNNMFNLDILLPSEKVALHIKNL